MPLRLLRWSRISLLSWASGLLKVCASLELAIVLLVLLTAVLALGTCVESWYGEAAARFGVYGAWWFTALAALLAANIFAALLIRFPWKKRQTGFVLTHVGLLVLLAGCLLTHRGGIDASLPVLVGQANGRAYQDSYHFELTSAGSEPICVPFVSGPFSWIDYQKLPWFPWRLAGRDTGILYDRDGIRLEALDYQIGQRPQVSLRVSVDGHEPQEFRLGPAPSHPLASLPEGMQKIIAGRGRQVAVSLRPDEIDLGVEVLLRKFRRRLDPGSSQASHYSSLIDLIDRNDPGHTLQSDLWVTLNGPVDFRDPASGRSYRLFQAAANGSYFTLNYDPGRWLKYAGSLLVIAGIFCTYFLKPIFARPAGSILAATLLTVCGFAPAADAASLDWGVWQRLPVLENGRMMPLDTFARTAVKKICGSDAPQLGLAGSLSAGEPAAVVPAAVAELLEGQTARSFAAGELFMAWLVEPEKWEYVPFLPADDPQLRGDLLGLPLTDDDGRPLRYVSPRHVCHAVKYWRRLAEINRQEQQAAAAGQRAQFSAADQKAAALLESYTSYRRLSYSPLSPRDGRGRLLDKLSSLVQIWNDLEDSLLRFPAEKGAGAANPIAETIAGIQKLAALADKDEELSLSAAEPLLASLERSTAGIARQMADVAEHMRQSPPKKMEQSQIRRARMLMNVLAFRTGELARQAAAARLALYDNGESLRLAPALDAAALEADRDPNDDAQPWASLQTLLYGSDGLLGGYPRPQLQEMRTAWRQVADAYRDRANPRRPEQFAAATKRLAAALGELGRAVEPLRNALVMQEKDDELIRVTAYPPPGSTDAEVFYNRLDPFFWSWVASLIAVVGLAASLVALRKPMFWLGMLWLLAADALIVAGFMLRMEITGWAPVTNMFETIVFVALSAAVLGMWFTLLPLVTGTLLGRERLEQVYARRSVALVGAVVALTASILAYYASAFPKDIHPLMPVLRSNFWLALHVLTITASYGAAALAWGLGNVTLGFYLAGNYRKGREPDACAALAGLTYKVIQIAVLLLAVGTFLGAMWADVSWGRFWGWDSKETWALISLLAYLIILHGRSIGWSGNFAMALNSVLGFSAIVVTWYVVNFLMPGGKHSYGEAAGGQWLVFTVAAADWLFVAAAGLRYLLQPQAAGEGGG